MDSLTHLVVGACIGEVFLGKQLGRRALLWGAIAQSAPDIDVVATLWNGTAENLLAHRGFTHSFLFAAVITPLFALAADRWHRPHDIRFSRFCWFFGVAVFGHTLLDGLNSYGTGWFEPFSHARIALNVLFVADPFFTFGAGVAAIVLLFLRRHRRYHRQWAWAGIAWSMCYLGFCAWNKTSMEREVHRMLDQQHVTYTRTFITPTVLNNWLWYVVAGDDRGYHIGYRSVFDTADTLELHYFPRRTELLDQVEDKVELDYLVRFAQEFYTVEQLPDSTLLFNDLRFGQIMGWRDPQAKFVFHYYLHDPARNQLVVQRGRFGGWDSDAVPSLVRRIRGDHRSR
ncbi:MAG: metal-dependent hydrolase [Flavobacteriales bacterium]